VSKDDYYEWDNNGDLKSTALEGRAILAELAIGWQVKSSWTARINANYIMNDSAWYNPLAQSPAFFARRVANSDKDGDLLKMGPRSPFYTTFDALYHFVPKFTPVDKVLSTGDPQKTDEGHYAPTKSYAIAPFPKNSYNTGVYTRDELALLQRLADPVLQNALPNGLATANRVGPAANLTLGFGKSNEIEVQGVFAMLEENQAMDSAKAKFTEFGGGGKVDIGSLAWGLPLELSGSYKNSKSELGEMDFTSDFINAGFYAKFYKRFGFSAGFQQINTTSEPSAPVDCWFLGKGKQKQWMAGLDYTLAKNAWVALNYGQISVKNIYKTDDPASANGMLPEALLPIYIEEAIKNNIKPKNSTSNSLEHSFKQNLMEASINVSF